MTRAAAIQAPAAAPTALCADSLDAALRAAAPLISVITPSFNQGPFIERCIQSVLAQNYPNFEHIICDNCSTDQTLEVLRRYPHVQWISEPDRGQSDALNKALSRARGEIIAWINADDYYEPGAFDIAARELSFRTGQMIVLGRMRFVDADGHVQSITQPHFHGRDYLIDFWSHEHGLTQPGMFIRKEAFDAIGTFDASLHYAMDYDLWLRLASRYPIRIVDDVLAGFVVHPASKTGQSRFHGGFRQELRRVSRRYWGSPLSRKYWRNARDCARYTANLLIHAILDSHRHAARLDWSLVAELARAYPPGLLNRHVLAVLGERVCGAAFWKTIQPQRGAQQGSALSPDVQHGSVCSSSKSQNMAEPCSEGNGRVTVVIPTFNRAALVGRAVHSALAQSASDVCDIVVVDDGSTDDTATVIRGIGHEILCLQQPHRGVSAARNLAIRAHPNEFIAFLDSDDEWPPEHVARLLDALRRHPTALLAASRGVLVENAQSRWSPDRLPIPFDQPVDLAPHLFERTCLLTPTIMVRRAAALQAGLFNTTLARGEDYLLWLRLACRGPAVMVDNDVVQCGWRAPQSLTLDSRQVLRDELRVRYLMQRELRRRPDCRAAWRRGLGRTLALLRDRAYGDRDFARAARYAFRSLMIAPRGRSRWEWGRLPHALIRSI